MMIAPKTNKQMVDEIIKNFDFEKVHRVMVFLDWRWGGYTGDPNDRGKVPTMDELKKAARDRCEEALKFGTSVTGGFHASYEYGELSLKFALDTWEVSKEGEV